MEFEFEKSGSLQSFTQFGYSKDQADLGNEESLECSYSVFMDGNIELQTNVINKEGVMSVLQLQTVRRLRG